MFHSEDVALRTTAWRLAAAVVPAEEVHGLVAELVLELGRGDEDTQRSLNRVLAHLGGPARARLEAIAAQTHAALALFDDPSSDGLRNVDLARKIALWGTHEQD